jgi:hypothetical protein
MPSEIGSGGSTFCKPQLECDRRPPFPPVGEGASTWYCSLALGRRSTLCYAENVRTQFHSLRQVPVCDHPLTSSKAAKSALCWT